MDVRHLCALSLWVWSVAVVLPVVTSHGAIVRGNALVDGEVLEAAPRAFVLSGQGLALLTGIVTRVGLFTTGPELPVRLQVWRPVAGATFRLVDEFEHVTTKYGVEEVDLVAARSVLYAEEGDLIGFTTLSRQCPLAYTEAPFTQGALLRAHVVTHTPSGSLYPTTGQVRDFSGDFFHVKFSIQVTLETGHNSCQLSNGGCDHVCHVEVTRRSSCTCHSGFRLGSDMRSCEDVDECTDTSACQGNNTCVNVPGSYVCVTEGVAPSLGGTSQALEGGIHIASRSWMTSHDTVMGLFIWLVIDSLVIVALAAAVVHLILARQRALGASDTASSRLGNFDTSSFGPFSIDGKVARNKRQLFFL